MDFHSTKAGGWTSTHLVQLGDGRAARTGARPEGLVERLSSRGDRDDAPRQQPAGAVDAARLLPPLVEPEQVGRRAQLAAVTDVAEQVDDVGDRCQLGSPADLLRLYERWQKTGSAHCARRLVSRGVIPVAPATLPLH